MSVQAGLPYDSSPHGDIREPALLDKALDDAAQTRANDLLGRMGQGKVYLLEESSAAAAGGPSARVRSTAKRFQDVDGEAWLTEATSTAISPIRTNALHISGEPLAHMPTDKVFLYATDFGAAPLGIEWINDTNLVLLFHDAQAALLAIAVLAKAGFDFNDDPLESRSAHHVPSALLPLQNKDKELTDSTEPPKSRSRYDPAPLATGQTEDYADLAPGLRPLARMDIRFAMESDIKNRGKPSESRFYQENGRGAGKYHAGGKWHRGGGVRGVGVGQRRETPYDRPVQAGRRQQPTQEELDAELDGLRSGDVKAGMDVDVNMDGSGQGHGQGHGRREQSYGERRGGRGRGRRGERSGGGGDGRRERPVVAGKDDLDRELDAMLAGRST